MHELPWITIFCHEWGASRVTQIAVIHGNEFIILFLTRYFMSSTHKSPKTMIECSFRHCCQKRSFLTWYCDVTTIDLWRHAKARYWYCDVIFVDCYCTRKLAQRRSSLVNNSREYRYPTTRCKKFDFVLLTVMILGYHFHPCDTISHYTLHSFTNSAYLCK